jgi:hypothetical protein
LAASLATLLLGTASVATAATEEAPRTDAEPGSVFAPADQPQAEPASPAAPLAPAAAQGSTTIVTILPPERPRPAGEAPALKLGGSQRPAPPASRTPVALVRTAPSSRVAAQPATPSAVAASLSRDAASPAEAAPTSEQRRVVAARRQAAAPAREVEAIAARAYRPASHVPRRPAVTRPAATAPPRAKPKPTPPPAATRPAAPPPRLERAAPAAVIVAPETIPSALLLALGAGLGLMLASTLPRALAESRRPRWLEQGQVAVGGIGLACALVAFAVLLAAA